MFRKIALVLLGLAITAVLALNVAGIFPLPFLERLELAIYDTRVRLTTSDTRDPRIVIIDIDERSIAEEGRWPWRRDRLAHLVDQLVDVYGVEVVGFDMVFPEPEPIHAVDQLRELAVEYGDAPLAEGIERYRPLLDRDAEFARSIAESGRVVLGYFFHHQASEASRAGVLPAPLYDADSGLHHTTYAVQATGYAGNLEAFQRGALAAGFFSNPVVDEDGVFRRVPVLVEFEQSLYASLSLAALQAYLGVTAEPVLAPGSDELGSYPALEALDIAGTRIPIDANATAMVPYRGPQGSFPYVSAIDVLNGTVADPDALAGTIALLGTTAAGLMDLRATPVQNVYPGVEVHANMIAGMLDGTVRQRPAYTVAVELLMVVVSGAVLAILLPITGPIAGAVAALGVLGVVTAINFHAWENLLHVIPFASALSTIVLVYVLNVVFGFFFEARSKHHLGRLFGQYVPPELVEEMSQNPRRYSLEGEKRELTVLFSDVRNFTSISESMDPHELTRMMNAFLTPLTRAVHQSKGTIDKYMGDAMMAFWGAPVADERHASHAVCAALEMLSIIDSLQSDFHREGWAEIRVGIGINSGEMSVGNMGSEFRMAYTVMGDAVNLASRLEGLTKQYGVPLIVSEYTAAMAPEFQYIELDQVRVKGKSRPVSIHMPLGLRSAQGEPVAAFATRHHEALASYRAQRFDEAFEWFAGTPPIAALERLYVLYRERIAMFRETPPPPDWDGVFEVRTK